ncbi:MAG: HPr family phosphocarrier protein, partial [Holophaga sp.]|nr:HPr family phosphocarrier protein [Holophaga sp.]
MVVSTPAAVQLELRAPLSGILVPLDEVPDPVFAGRLVGDGIAIDPTSSVLVAPLAGTVTQLHAARHALAITSASGVEVLLHIGLDTVELKGEGFQAKVRVGDRVAAGQPLVAFDPALVGRRARSLLTLMVIPDGARVASLRPASGLVVAGRDLALALTLVEGEAGAAGAGGTTVESEAVVLPNPAGLHARPAALLAAEAKRFGAAVRLVKGGTEVNAKSVVAILGLGARGGDALRVRATGAGAAEAAAALAALLAAGCGDASGESPAAAPRAPAGVGELAGVPAITDEWLVCPTELSLGGYVSCIELQDDTLPAARRWLELQLRVGAHPVEFSSPPARWRARRQAACCPPNGFDTAAKAVSVLGNIKAAITQLASDRAQIGANIVRLNSTHDQLGVLK